MSALPISSSTYATTRTAWAGESSPARNGLIANIFSPFRLACKALSTTNHKKMEAVPNVDTYGIFTLPACALARRFACAGRLERYHGVDNGTL